MPVYIREATNFSSYQKVNPSCPVRFSDSVCLPGRTQTPKYDDSLKTIKAVEYSGINSTKSPASGAAKISKPRLMSQFEKALEAVCVCVCVCVGVFLQS
jgi:hypothetical protein